MRLIFIITIIKFLLYLSFASVLCSVLLVYLVKSILAIMVDRLIGKWIGNFDTHAQYIAKQYVYFVFAWLDDLFSLFFSLLLLLLFAFWFSVQMIGNVRISLGNCCVYCVCSCILLNDLCLSIKRIAS